MKPTPDNKAKLPTLSKEVAKCVGKVVHAAESIRGKCRALSQFGLYNETSDKLRTLHKRTNLPTMDKGLSYTHSTENL